ncbi:MAG: hypothetical protein LBS62_00645, partial [Clostridiales bacterium]|nr:hypothetical protein [Clostridiales bacterium]
MSKRTNQIFDKAIKRILGLSHPAVVDLFNGLFDKNFPLNSRVTYHETETVSDTGRTIADPIINLTPPEERGKNTLGEKNAG